MPAPKLTPPQITDALKAAPEWGEVGETIQRTYQFADFVTAMRFVQGVAVEAERAQHHPDILIRYGKVTLTLATHDSGGITEKDFGAARHADEIARSLPGKPATGVVSGPKKKK